MVSPSIAHKIVGYFSYSGTGNVFCDGDACIISATEELMHSYIKKMIFNHNERDIVKKTRLSEIINGLRQGGAYAFDRDSYAKFFSLVEKQGLFNDLPNPKDCFLEPSPTGLHFVRLKFV